MTAKNAKLIGTKHLSWLAVCLFVFSQQAIADRVKDLAAVAGVRSNQLVGYGLVIGLDGTGDQTSQTPFTIQSLKNMLTQFGITIPPGVNLQVKNVAAVAIHADLPPFSKPGQTIDVTVASIGNAKSLRGGSLLLAPLRGADGNMIRSATAVAAGDSLSIRFADGNVGAVADRTDTGTPVQPGRRKAAGRKKPARAAKKPGGQGDLF